MQQSCEPTRYTIVIRHSTLRKNCALPQPAVSPQALHNTHSIGAGLRPVGYHFCQCLGAVAAAQDTSLPLARHTASCAAHKFADNSLVMARSGAAPFTACSSRHASHGMHHLHNVGRQVTWRELLLFVALTQLDNLHLFRSALITAPLQQSLSPASWHPSK